MPEVVRILSIWFNENYMRITFSVNVELLWHYVPGSRRGTLTDGALQMLYCYELDPVIEMLSKLPLIDPTHYRIDWDTKDVPMKSTRNLRARISNRKGVDAPKHCSRSRPTDGNYVTEVRL